MGVRRGDTPVSTREVVNRALDLAAPALILVHNQVNQKNAYNFEALDATRSGK
jgi:hypothetical protein